MNLLHDLKHMLDPDKDKPVTPETETPVVAGNVPAGDVAGLPQHSGSPQAALQTPTPAAQGRR